MRCARQSGAFAREFVFVDDGSSDGSADLIAALTQGWRDKIVILRQPNRGASAATNAGARRAAQPWLKLVDGDDLLVPGATARLLEAAQAAGQTLAYGELGTYRFDDPDPLARDFPLPPHRMEPDGLARFIRNCPCNSSTILVSKERYWAAGGCDERLVSPDQALFLRLFAAGGAAHIAAPVALAPDQAPRRLSEQARRSRYESVLALYYLVTETKGLDPRYVALAYRRAMSRACRFHRAHLGAPLSPPSGALSCEPVPHPGSTESGDLSRAWRLHRGWLERAARRVEAGRVAAARNRQGLKRACAALPASSIPTIASIPRAMTRSPARWRTGSRIAGRTTAAPGATPRPASRWDSGALPFSISRLRGRSRSIPRTARS